MEVQLLEDVLAMTNDRRRAEIQDVSNVFIRLPLGKELQNLSFPPCQQVIAVFNVLLLEEPHVVIGQNTAHFWAEERFALTDGPHRVDNFRFRGTLQDIAARAGS